MPPIKLRDTLRKKASTKAESTTATADDVTSVSGDSVSTSSWVEAQAVQNGDLISRQISTTSRSPGPPSQRAKDPSEASLMDSIQLTSSPRTLVTDDLQSPSPKVTRRRKTVTKTPHTFELAEDLKSITRPEDSDRSTEEQRPEALNPPTSSLNGQARSPEVTSLFTCSKVTTTVSIEPIKARASPLPSQSPPRSAPPNPFTINHRQRQSSSSSQAHSPPIPTSNPARFTPPTPASDTFFGKVVVLVHGASPTGASIVRSLHASGARVILGDSDADSARQLVKSLGEPHLVHFNKCDARRYEDLVALFKLAFAMYGRVDHAILGVGEDGGGTGGISEGETGWFEHAATKGGGAGIEAVEHEPPGLVDTLGTAVRFAHIALAYLRHTPKVKTNKLDSLWATTTTTTTNNNRRPGDRSLTFLTSVASFREMPGLPIYQVAQHGVIGLMRSLRSSVDPEKDGVRVNAVVTGMMVPRAFGGVGGRMSVKLPSDMPEDVGRTVVGVVAAGSAEGGNGVWYERGSERGVTERDLHGRAIYVVGGECWDIEDGLNRSEQIWLGAKPSEMLTKAQEGIGRQSQWIFL